MERKAKNMILQKGDATIAFSVRWRKDYVRVTSYKGTEFKAETELTLDQGTFLYYNLLEDHKYQEVF